ncbi:FAD/NAD-P-binding domain-containing protein [Gymnopilus junonius]|uniref:FAD/NAD-P-binding domain-containing protein n=1 Tax=Gymnopilus junonius TaxID=109634 RepID=A0A9P5NJ77_GYMJU|nr:FAD/NAD-P-binding domain-containing protein [Gymnopilus junonius]
MKVVIVGAGPAGLVTCKSLLEASEEDFPFDPVVLEQEGGIGGTFRYRSYEHSYLVSSKQLTSFSDFRLPLSHSDHLTLDDYVQYLENYAKHFDLHSRIRLNSKVIKIERMSSGKHMVSYVQNIVNSDGKLEWESRPQKIIADYVALCAGLHVTPSIPQISGIEHILRSSDSDGDNYPPAIFHSVQYKARSQLAGRHVMILGSGETGMDLTYEAVKAGAKQVILCSRSGFLSFPKALNDFEIFGMKFNSENPVPIDSLITNLGETAYVHPWIARSHVRWFISDFVIKHILWFLTGTHAGCNQWVGELEPERLGRAYVFLNKSHKAMPYLNRPYRTRPWYLDYISRYIDPPEDSPPLTNFVAELAPFPTHFLMNGQAIFPLSKRKDAVRINKMIIKPDTVIYATGYTQEFSYLDKASCYPSPQDADLRNIARTGDEDFAFIGYIRPGVGAIPPLAEMQAFFWISLIKKLVDMPLSPAYYHLLMPKSARIMYGVDHSTYASTLAKDMKTAPGLIELWWEYGSKVFICYCFGASFTPFYRLFGPFRSEWAPGIIKTEIWETITRRGVAGNLVMGLVPMIFYLTLNTIAYCLALLWRLFGKTV